MKRPSRQRYASDGFTLLEVTVALMILAGSLVVLIDSVRQGTEMFLHTRDLVTAQALARRVMAEQKLSDEIPMDNETNSGSFEEPEYSIYSWEATYQVNENIEGLKELVPELTKSLFLLKVTITWAHDDGYEQSYELRTVMLYELPREQQPQ